MKVFHRYLAGLALLALLSATGTELIAKDKKKKQAVVTQMDDHQRALHVLNRLTFGPRPGDVERVQAMGVDKWIEQQLNPSKIDDSAIEARLSQYRTLKMNTREMVANFPPPQVL